MNAVEVKQDMHYVSMLRTNAHLFEFNSHSKHGNNKDHHLVRIQQCDLRKRIGSDSTVRISIVF